MQIIVVADEAGREEFKAKNTRTGIEVVYIEDLSALRGYGSADAFFLLKDDIDKEGLYALGAKPVFINSTINTLKELNLPVNYSRINGWPCLLNREIWEIATLNENAVRPVFENLGWKYAVVADEPGLISARIISMIINEAYFASGENVSSEKEIDIAMKLGTNYPYGPFEWSRKIGLKRVYNLLEKLSKTDKRYAVAPALKNDLVNS